MSNIICRSKKRYGLDQVMWTVICVVSMFAFALILASCTEHHETSDDIQREQQEAMLSEATASVGMPAITHFRERRLLKDILELRDQEGLTTWTYLHSDMTGKLTLLGESIGYGIPASTQYSNPAKIEWSTHGGAGYQVEVLPQADPNGLFSPASAEGTWVMLKDPNGSNVRPIYVEPRIVVSPFPLTLPP